MYVVMLIHCIKIALYQAFVRKNDFKLNGAVKMSSVHLTFTKFCKEVVHELDSKVLEHSGT